MSNTTRNIETWLERVSTVAICAILGAWGFIVVAAIACMVTL